MQSVMSRYAYLLCMIDCFDFFTGFVRKNCSFASIYIALLLFGQVFFSAVAYSFGLENRLVMLLFRAAIAFCSLYVIWRSPLPKKGNFLKFSLCL